MKLALIAAVDRNLLIGSGPDIPWMGEIPADLKHFKETTLGHPVIMGMTTFLSIGRPLPGRKNIVMTRDSSVDRGDVAVVHSLNEALSLVFGEEKVFVIGGASIYKLFLPSADLLYITQIDHEFEGDIYFPTPDKDMWKLTKEEHHAPDGQNKYPYTFKLYERIHTTSGDATSSV